MKIKGVIFDLDGTILDSTWVWSRIDIDFLGKHGISVPEDYAKAIISMSFEDVARYTIERFSLTQTVEEVMDEWNRMARDSYAHEVTLKPGTKELLLWLQEQGIPAGIATSNSASLFVPCLKNNGIYDLFHSFTETGDVKRGKEFPDVYIKAAEKLGCKPEECVVFEDIMPALRAAKKGGFVTVGVRENKWNYAPAVFAENCDFVISEIYEAISLLENANMIGGQDAGI
ncbi:MAG: HAD family phosphatase [Eubacterium sp.]|nr:HAD family phosphatase [Eubacterium sp.]